jgi:hypothetical protein
MWLILVKNVDRNAKTVNMWFFNLENAYKKTQIKKIGLFDYFANTLSSCFFLLELYVCCYIFINQFLTETSSFIGSQF